MCVSRMIFKSLHSELGQCRYVEHASKSIFHFPAAVRNVWVGGEKIIVDAMDTNSDAEVYNETQLSWIDGMPMLPFEPGHRIYSPGKATCFRLNSGDCQIVGHNCITNLAVICEAECRPGKFKT